MKIVLKYQFNLLNAEFNIGFEQKTRKKKENNVAKIIRFRANPRKETYKPLPIIISFGAENPTNWVVEEVKQAKVLLYSLKFKNVFYNKDLTLSQIVQWKKLFYKKLKQEMMKMKNKTQARTKGNNQYRKRNEMMVKVNLNRT